LSFTSTLSLLTRLDELRNAGAQVVVATHSPLLTALPGLLATPVVSPEPDHGADGVRVGNPARRWAITFLAAAMTAPPTG
jgi:hypothetical protein